MANKDNYKLPKYIRLGKTASSQEARTPNGLSKGRVRTNLQDINWTPTK
ncbi:MAG: hypothetical protein ACFCAD_03880 [Pleurocapsa sp.]